MTKLNERMEAGTDASIPTNVQVNHVCQTIAKPNVVCRLSITDKLTREEQQHLLNTLFGFDLVNVDAEIGKEHWVLYDEEGYEFYGSDKNCQFDFSTLAGIFSYTAHRAKNQGYTDCQYAMRKVLGVS